MIVRCIERMARLRMMRICAWITGGKKVGEYLLGIDIGTTGSKVLLIDQAGEIVDSATHEYPVFHA